uniref:DUF202 domain-containing protein n=1 Tax=Mycena chlorophos TaxID=658473 RepID=A0ABQ0L0H3_MYCCL|nr:predicted protein [Mycena chlorophos]
MFTRLRGPIYKNTGSVARDHLASERTYLAWLRTGLGFVALGIAVERFAQLNLTELLKPPAVRSEEQAKPSEHDHPHGDADLLAGALLGTGGGAIAYGLARYFSTMRLLEQGLFRPSFYGAGSLGLAVAGISGIVYWTAVKDRRPPQGS